MSENKKKQIMQTILKAILMIGIVAFISYVIIHRLEENKKDTAQNTTSTNIEETVVASTVNETEEEVITPIEEEIEEYIIDERTITSGDWTYYVSENKAILCGYSGNETSISLPLDIDGYSATGFTSGVCYYNKKLISVDIPVGYTEIPEEAFIGCENLAKVTMESTVTKISGNAFAGCSAMKNLTIGRGIIEISPTALLGLTNLEAITISEENSAYKIIDNMLYDINGRFLIKAVITSNELTISSNTEEIYEYAIANSEKLTNLILPTYLNTIYDNAIYNCPNIGTVNIGQAVGTIEGGAFAKSQVTNFVVDSKNKYYMNSEDGLLLSKDGSTLICFPSGSEMTDYRLPSDIRYLSTKSFVDCSNLKSLYIPSSIYMVYFNAFVGNENLTITTEDTESFFNPKCQANWNINYLGTTNHKE